MPEEIVGWLVRTEADSLHRYWKVGVVEAARAEAVALELANADTARAVTKLTSRYTSRYIPSPGVATEFTWESTPVATASQQAKLNLDVSGRVILEVTFDTVLPTEGVTCVEGCYRLNGGNWFVYYFTNNSYYHPSVAIPIIDRDAVFSSGLHGITAYFPSDRLITKERVGEVLVGALCADDWVEVTGVDSLLLK